MDLINAITTKKDWQTKIKDIAILRKWVSEFIAQGVNKNIIKKVIELLELSLKEHNYDDYDAKYKWILNVTSDFNDIGLKCNGCECADCSDCVYQSDDSEFKEYYEEQSQIKCTCKAVLNLDKIKQTYLEKFIVVADELITKKVRQQFIKAVDEFADGKPVDYHPGSNEMMVDIIHPSLYCFIKDVTMAKTIESYTPSLFQWIPANYSTAHNKFISPINSCDQKENPSLYKSIETIFKSFIPQFQVMFNNLHNNNKLEKKIDLDKYHNLQVIVKIGSTRLTPEKPFAPSSSWHLEGVREENIIGTGIYYYDMENIMDSYLSFRTVVNRSNINYPQGQDNFVHKHYGLLSIQGGSYNETESVVALGNIKTKKNMALVFPNFLQHRVEEFKLVDKTEEGHRSILVFFLIDPRIKITSSADIINNEMSLNDAKMYRELLMFQRKYEVKDQHNFFERNWSLCEH
jgi:hypothetical protein